MTNSRTSLYWKCRDAYKRAERVLVEKLKQAEDASVLLQLGQVKLALEDFAEAEKCLLRAVDMNNEAPEAYASLGVVFMRKDRYESASEYFEDSLKRDPDNLTVRSNLAEAYLKAKKVDRAEAEYKKILEITSGHVESLIGLGEVYTAMAEDGDGDLYASAIDYFTRGKNLGESGEGSKKLKKKELAALLYSRGYARIKLYETPKIRRDEAQRFSAERDFSECVRNDSQHHKARRALEKIQARNSRFSADSLRERVGPWFIAIMAFSILILTQAKFFFDFPKAHQPAPIAQQPALKATTIEQLASAIKAEKIEAPQAANPGEKGDGGTLSAGYYAMLTFGSLIFMVAGLYLPQILKLKVAGIELEKSSVDQIGTGGTLGIRK